MNVVDKLDYGEALKRATESLKTLPTELVIGCSDGVVHLFAEEGGVCIPGVGYLVVAGNTINKKYVKDSLKRLATSYLNFYNRPVNPRGLANHAMTLMLSHARDDLYGRYPQYVILLVDNLLETYHVVSISQARTYSARMVLGVGRFSTILTNSLRSLNVHQQTCDQVCKLLLKDETYRGTDLRPGALKARILRTRSVAKLEEYGVPGPQFTSFSHRLDEGGQDLMGPFIEKLVYAQQVALDESA